MIQYILSKILTIFVFLIIFTIIVVSHEFGHFLLGRLNGIKVKEFAIGMGPVIFKKKLKSTILKIHLLPIGGACMFDSDEFLFQSDLKKEIKEINEDDSLTDDEKKEAIEELKEEFAKEIEDDEETKDLPGGKFQDASIWGRIATALAGPIFNFITGYLFCILIVWHYGQDLPVVYDVNEGMPAYEAGIRAGDTIKSIDNKAVYLWREVSLNSMMSYGDPMKIKYEREGQTYETVIYPEYDEGSGRYYLGLIGGGAYIECNNLSVFKYTYCEIRFMVNAIYKSLAHMSKGNVSVDDFAGPVGIANIVDDTIQEASPYGSFAVVMHVINLIVLLSINLGIMNLLPFPALDGGRLIFLFIELITRKKVPADKEGIIHLIGFALLFIFMIVVFFNDISHIVKSFM